MTHRPLILACVALCAGIGSASAQTVRNPTQVVWTPSVDHAAVTSYRMGWFIDGATEPVQQADLGKPAPNAQNECIAAIPSYPIGITYVAKLVAVAGSVTSDWSAASNPFLRTPAPPPSAPVVR